MVLFAFMDVSRRIAQERVPTISLRCETLYPSLMLTRTFTCAAHHATWRREPWLPDMLITG